MNGSIEKISVSGDYRQIDLTVCKKSAMILINAQSGQVNVICKNAAHAAYKDLGRFFDSIEDAIAGYKSAEMKAAIEFAGTIDLEAREEKEVGVQSYWPEMGEEKPKCDGEVTLSHYGKHYFISTPLELKTGRSVKFLDKYTPENTRPGSYKMGWNNYQVTKKGFEALKKQYSFSREALLD